MDEVAHGPVPGRPVGFVAGAMVAANFAGRLLPTVGAETHERTPPGLIERSNGLLLEPESRPWDGVRAVEVSTPPRKGLKRPPAVRPLKRRSLRCRRLSERSTEMMSRVATGHVLAGGLLLLAQYGGGTFFNQGVDQIERSMTRPVPQAPVAPVERSP